MATSAHSVAGTREASGPRSAGFITRYELPLCVALAFLAGFGLALLAAA